MEYILKAQSFIPTETAATGSAPEHGPPLLATAKLVWIGPHIGEDLIQNPEELLL